MSFLHLLLFWFKYDGAILLFVLMPMNAPLNIESLWVYSSDKMKLLLKLNSLIGLGKLINWFERRVPFMQKLSYKYWKNLDSVYLNEKVISFNLSIISLIYELRLQFPIILLYFRNCLLYIVLTHPNMCMTLSNDILN